MKKAIKHTFGRHDDRRIGGGSVWMIHGRGWYLNFLLESSSLSKDVGRVERAWGAAGQAGPRLVVGLSLALAAVSTATGPPGAHLGHGETRGCVRAWGTRRCAVSALEQNIAGMGRAVLGHKLNGAASACGAEPQKQMLAKVLSGICQAKAPT